MSRIYIGLDKTEKLGKVTEYLRDHPEITHIVYFHPDKMEALELTEIIDLEVEVRTWSDAIMYRYFYPLLEHINEHYLIIYDEMMRTKKAHGSDVQLLSPLQQPDSAQHRVQLVPDDR